MNLFLFASCGDYLKGGEAARTALNLMDSNRAPMFGTVYFEIVVLLLVVGACVLMYRRVPHFPLKFLATAAGVMIFEFFTAPMWQNRYLGPWAYVYHDVSWILTLGWTTLILGTITVVDRTTPKLGEFWHFLLYLVVLLPLVLAAENAVVWLGIRLYSPEVRKVFSGRKIGEVPIEALYYVPVFTSLVIGFAKYWGFVIDDAALVPMRRTRWLRALILTFLAVGLFEVMVEPMVDNVGLPKVDNNGRLERSPYYNARPQAEAPSEGDNKGLPAWSFYYRDLSVILTGLWVVIIAVAGIVVQRFLAFQSIPRRFAVALLLITALALPLEAWLISHGYRVYGPSAEDNFCGVKVWGTIVPVEVAIAIPMYAALMVAFIRYWEIVGDNKR